MEKLLKLYALMLYVEARELACNITRVLKPSRYVLGASVVLVALPGNYLTTLNLFITQ